MSDWTQIMNGVRSRMVAPVADEMPPTQSVVAQDSAYREAIAFPSFSSLNFGITAPRGDAEIERSKTRGHRPLVGRTLITTDSRRRHSTLSFDCKWSRTPMHRANRVRGFSTIELVTVIGIFLI